MHVSRDEMKEHLAGGGVVESGGQVYRSGDKVPEHVQEGVLLRDQNGRLTRAGMEHAIKRRGSVLYRGQTIDNVEELPDEADLVKHDERQKKVLAESLDAQIAALTHQRAKLEQGEDPDRPPPHKEAETKVATQTVMQGGELKQVPAVPDVRHPAKEQPGKPASAGGGTSSPPPPPPPGPGVTPESGSLPAGRTPAAGGAPAPAFPPPEEARPRRGRRSGSGEEE